MERATSENNPCPEPYAAGLARHAVSDVVRGSKGAAHRAGEALKDPKSSAAIAGAAVGGAAIFFGLGPAAVAATAGYTVYRILKKRPPA